MNIDVLYDQILNHTYWFHRIPLGDGKFTPGLFQRDPFNWEQLKLPDRLDGKSFLDIGAFDGLHSFEAEKRGAERVLATDIWYGSTGKEGFDLVREYLNSNVEDRIIDVYDISPEKIGRFDVVLCAGLVYHVRDPYLAIKNAVSVANELVVIESAITKNIPCVPGMEFKSASPASPTEIRWEPNLQCLEQMLTYAGCIGVTSHSYNPQTDPSTNIPPVRNGVITKPTTLYRDYALNTKLDNLKPGTQVFILLESNTSTRVGARQVLSSKNEIIKAAFQGWVDTNDVREINQNPHPVQLHLSAIVNTLRHQGVSGALSTLSKRVYWRVYRVLSNPYRANEGPRGVVSGYITNNTK